MYLVTQINPAINRRPLTPLDGAITTYHYTGFHSRVKKVFRTHFHALCPQGPRKLRFMRTPLLSLKDGVAVGRKLSRQGEVETRCVYLNDMIKIGTQNKILVIVKLKFSIPPKSHQTYTQLASIKTYGDSIRAYW